MRVPVLATDHDTFLHRRDPRVKWLVFALLVAFLYIAPTWEWMVAMAVLGLLLGYVGRTSKKLLLVLWLLQVPNLLGLVIIPVLNELLARGEVVLDGGLQYSLKLGFAWSAALFMSIAIFSTMQIEELVDGLHGLRLPSVVGFTFGYAFLLLYTSVSDLFRIADALKVKGVELESRNPLRLLASVPRLFLPALFTVARRANTMMAVLQMRGYSPTLRGGRRSLGRPEPADLALLAGAVAFVGAALGDRLGVFSLAT